jgi:hypothetical protein
MGKGRLAETFVEVGVRDHTASGLSRVQTRLSQFSGSVRGAVNIPVMIGTGLAGAGITRFLMGATESAGDLNETLSKVGVVFGGSAGKVIGFADDMAGKFGLVKREMMDAAASFGLVLQGSGMTAEASAGLSIQLAKLAADAASFYNVPVGEALEKIRSGLVGEAEPLRAFGVLLSEGAVKLKAASMGFKDLTEAAKSAARAALIVEGLDKASGDLARTSDSLANQQRALAGEYENFKANIGAMLTGPAADMLGTFKQILGVVSDTFDPNRPKAFGAAMAGATAGSGGSDLASDWGNLYLTSARQMIGIESTDPATAERDRNARAQQMEAFFNATNYDAGLVAERGLKPMTPEERDTYLRDVLHINNPSTGGPSRGFGPGAINPQQAIQMLAPGLAVAGGLMFSGQGDLSTGMLRRSNEIDAYGAIGSRLSGAQGRLADMERSRNDRLAQGGVLGDQLSAVTSIQNELLNDLPKQQLEEQKKQVQLLTDIKERLGNGSPFALEQATMVLRGPE